MLQTKSCFVWQKCVLFLYRWLAENAEIPTESAPDGEESIESLETEAATEPEAEEKLQDSTGASEGVGDGADGEESQEEQEAPEAIDPTEQTEEPREEETTETTSTVGQCFVSQSGMTFSQQGSIVQLLACQ